MPGWNGSVFRGVQSIVTINESERLEALGTRPVESGRYQLTYEIGVSVVGHVFAAEDRETGERVAAKVFEGRLDSHDLLVPLRRYGLYVSSLSHPGIASVRSVFIDREYGYLVRELVEGAPLSTILSEGRLPLARVKDIALQVAEALAFAHDRGLFHGNLHPGNIFLLPDGAVKVTDFGLAHMLREETAATPRRTKDGLYMAPEQLAGVAIDQRSDIYALGAVLWEAVSGTPPVWLRSNTAESPNRVPVRQHVVGDGVPGEWDELIMTMLELEPAMRFQTPEMLAGALRELPISSASPLSPHSAAPSPGAESQSAPPPDFLIREEIPSGQPPSAARAAQTQALPVPPPAPLQEALAPSEAPLAPELVTPAGRASADSKVEEAAGLELSGEAPVAPAVQPRFRVSLVVASLLAVLGAEVVTAYGNLISGVVIHVLLLGAFLTLAALVGDKQVRAFALTMALAPIVRIISMVMPLGNFAQPFWYLLTGVPLFAGIVSTARALDLSPSSLHLRLPQPRKLPLELLVALSGFGLGVTEWKILRPNAAIPVHSPVLWLLGAALILLIFTGLLEELLFRGLVQRVSEDLMGARGAILITAALFAILHIGWHSPVDLAFVFAVGLYFSLVVRYTRSLLGVTLAHGATNITLFLIVPLFFRSMM